MPRATNAVARKQRKKKVLNRAKGYFGRKHSSYRFAHEQLMRSDSSRTATGAPEEGLPAPLDHPDQRRRQAGGHELLAAHPRPQRGRRRCSGNVESAAAVIDRAEVLKIKIGRAPSR